MKTVLAILTILSIHYATQTKYGDFDAAGNDMGIACRGSINRNRLMIFSSYKMFAFENGDKFHWWALSFGVNL